VPFTLSRPAVTAVMLGAPTRLQVKFFDVELGQLTSGNELIATLIFEKDQSGVWSVSKPEGLFGAGCLVLIGSAIGATGTLMWVMS